MIRPFGPVALSGLLLLVGCGRSLNMQRDVELTQTQPSITFTVDPIRNQQTIKISATANNPITVLVGLAKDQKKLEDEAMSHRYSDKTLAKAEKTQDASLTATIPANEAAAVFVTSESSKAAKVNVKITN